MIKVSIDGSKLDTIRRIRKVAKVQEEMEIILNSDLFKMLVTNMKLLHGETSAWKDATGEEIYERIMSGASDLSPEKDSVINIFVDDYYSWKRVIGYTYPNTKTIYTNTKYFDSVNITQDNHHRKMTGSNFLHEYGHKIGFDHDFRATARRPYSICYQLNDIYESCWDALMPSRMKRVERIYSYRRWFRRYTRTVVELHDI